MDNDSKVNGLCPRTIVINRISNDFTFDRDREFFGTLFQENIETSKA